MSLNSKYKNRQGFTIIEVMIVLAIAGLILLIVFLAVPALQRSSRNNSRKNDAGRIVSAVSEFVSDNNGAQPATTTDATSIIGDAGQLGQFNGVKAGCATIGKPAAGCLAILTDTSGGAIPTAPVDQSLILLLDAQCSGTSSVTGATAGTPAASAPVSYSNVANSAVLLYPVEQGGSSYVWACDTAE